MRSLDPNTHRNIAAPEWAAWDPEGQRRMLFELGNLTMETTPTDQQERCEFWKGLAPITQQKR